MSRCFLGLCGVLSIALLAVAGCSTRTLASNDGADDGDGADGSAGDDGDGDGDGADGSGGDDGDGDEPIPPPQDPYPNCFEEDCPSGAGWGMDSECGMTCMCSVPCEDDDHCPLPWSGDAKAVCNGYECTLPCDPETICPEGMHCYPEFWQCMWGTYDPDDCGPDGDELCEDYCQMENLCLDMCGCDDGWCSCDSDQRYEECLRDCPRWPGDVEPPGYECGLAAIAWMECIVSLTCGDAVEFFMRYPDAFAPDTPCVAELFDARAACPNFELLTEYEF